MTGEMTAQRIRPRRPDHQRSRLRGLLLPKWEESERMTFPTSAHTSPGHPISSSHPTSTGLASTGLASTVQSGSHRGGSPTCTNAAPISRSDEGDHQREKLQFALAIALTRGDRQREQLLREQIAALGGYCEEPGT